MARTDRNPPEQLLMEIVQNIPTRVEPRCRHFGACGGCQLQDVEYAEQQAAKKALLVDVLHHAGLQTPPEIQTHTAGPWAYRNRARMRVQDNRIGYSMRASNAFLPIHECHVVSPLLWHCVSTLQALTQSGAATWPAATAAFEIFANDDESELQLSLQLDASVNTVARDAPQQLRTLCDRLQTTVPQLIGAGLSVAAAPNAAQPKRVQESQRVEIARWGRSSLRYRVSGRGYTITRNAFFQVNRFLTETMVQLVLGQRSGNLAWDLFAGAGLFSIPLTERFSRVIAVEIGEPAASDLAAHLATQGTQHRAERSTALDFLQRASLSKATTPDLIVVDPPRAGLGIATTKALAAANASAIVYVSCDAGSFARDARTMVESGYTMQSLHLLDLFPQTFHTETIALFHR